MGMFDWYEPEPPLRCPACQTQLKEWQSKEGPCGLFVWRPGAVAPHSQDVDEEWRHPNLVEVRLPQRTIGIYTTCEGCQRWITALAFIRDGIWTHTELETPENALQRSDESIQDFRVRKTRLAELLAGKPPGSQVTDLE